VIPESAGVRCDGWCFVNGAGSFNALWFLKLQVYAMMAEIARVCLEMTVLELWDILSNIEYSSMLCGFYYLSWWVLCDMIGFSYYYYYKFYLFWVNHRENQSITLLYINIAYNYYRISKHFPPAPLFNLSSEYVYKIHNDDIQTNFALFKHTK